MLSDIFFLFAGDFKIHVEPSSKDANKNKFSLIIESFNAHLLIRGPTRNESCIDDILAYKEQPHLSDHWAQIVSFELITPLYSSQ